MSPNSLGSIFNEDNSLQDTAGVLERALTLQSDPKATYADRFDALWGACTSLPLFWMGVDIMSGGQQRETYTDDTAYYVLSTREHVIDAEKKIAPARSAYVDSLGYRLGRPRHIVDVRENYAGAVAETIEDFRRNTLLHTLVEAGLSTLSPSMSKLAIGNVSSTSWNLLDSSAATSLLLGIEGDALARDTVTLLANDDQLSQHKLTEVSLALGSLIGGVGSAIALGSASHPVVNGLFAQYYTSAFALKYRPRSLDIRGGFRQLQLRAVDTTLGLDPEKKPEASAPRTERILGMLQGENNEQYNRAVGPDLIEVMLNGHLNSLVREIGKHRRYKLVSLAAHTTAAGLFGAQAL